jgi:uncharacterized lipoprotein YajG
VRTAVLLAAALVLAGCGGHKPSAQLTANTTLLDTIPVYPGSTAPKTTPGEAFGARDWALPAKAAANSVIDWYVQQLQARGWKVSGKSFNTIRASKHDARVSIGVRGRTLEVVANA